MYRLTLVVALIAGTAGCQKANPTKPESTTTPAAGPAAADRTAKSREFWEQWATLRKKHDPLLAPLQPWKYMSHAQTCAEQHELLVREVLALPLAGVDQELTQLAMDFVALYRQRAQSFRDQIALMQKTQALRDHSESDDALLEAFLRGVLGDPFGKANEIAQANAALQGEMRAFVTRSQAMETRFAELRARRDRVRARLIAESRHRAIAM